MIDSFLLLEMDFKLLNSGFLMPRLHTLYETILDKTFECRNFYKRFMELDILRNVGRRSRRRIENGLLRWETVDGLEFEGHSGECESGIGAGECLRRPLSILI